MHDTNIADSEKQLWDLIEERMRPGADVARIDDRIWATFGQTWAVVFTDLTGFSDPLDAERPDAIAPDGASGEAAVADATSEVAQGCIVSTVIDTPLTATLGTWTPFKFKQNEHPQVETFFGTTAAVLLPFLDTTPIPIDAAAQPSMT